MIKQCHFKSHCILFILYVVYSFPPAKNMPTTCRWRRAPQRPLPTVPCSRHKNSNSVCVCATCFRRRSCNKGATPHVTSPPCTQPCRSIVKRSSIQEPKWNENAERDDDTHTHTCAKPMGRWNRRTAANSEWQTKSNGRHFGIIVDLHWKYLKIERFLRFLGKIMFI